MFNIKQHTGEVKAMTKKRVPKWMKTLTAKERKHIKETTVRATLREFKENVTFHKDMRAENPDREPCWECKMIARKLALL